MSTEPLKVGDLIRDNDPRSTARTLKVTAIGDEKVLARRANRPEVAISLSRVYVDGKQRKSGWSRVEAK